MRNLVKYIYKRLQRKRTMLLLLALSLSATLLGFRFYYTQSINFIFLGWNLFLAWIPYGISSACRKYDHKINSSLILFPLVFLWLIFFPNAPYILTDLFHMQDTHNMPLWYDLILILSFSFSGLLLGFISLADFQYMITKRYNKSFGWIFTITTIISGSFGVYVGRYLRWNSWDILLNPIGIARDIYHIVFYPNHHTSVYGMTILLSCLFIIIYLSFYQLSKNQISKL